MAAWIPMALSAAQTLAKKPETYQRTTEMPNLRDDPFSRSAPMDDSWSPSASKMVTDASAGYQSDAEKLKQSTSKDVEKSWTDSVMGFFRDAPSKVDVDFGDARKAMAPERKEITQEEFDQKIQEKYDDQAAPLPSWISDTASVYSRLAQENAARDADLRAERRDSATNAINLLGQIPGIRDAWGRDAYSTRGLNVMAGN